jgi:altronate hydrolase
VLSVIHLHPSDNVCVAARALAAGESIVVAGREVVVREPIKQGHKLAIIPLAQGASVSKYGQHIGEATQSIKAGDWVHAHNLHANVLQQAWEKSTAIPQDPQPLTGYTFEGYRRPSGKVGTRNYLAIISNVNCSASVAHYVARRFSNEEWQQKYPHVDGVLAFSHGNGCGMPFGGEHHQILNRVLGGMAKHSNIGGYLLIGLGCETATMGNLMDEQRLVQIRGHESPVRPPVLVMQDLGGTQNTIDAAVKLVAELLPRVNEARRETCPASEIVLGTNCGGSDGNSGITANAALGVASDLLVACGGTSILGETTEIYGAEQVLTRRARTPAIADQLIERIKWWEWYAGVYGATCDNNPSPGNKEGGLTTIYEKSLGAIVKGGNTALNAVYKYAEEIKQRGFVVMDTPGLDPVSVTGIVAGGANVVVFTTGRGSCFGFKPSPVIKVASNTPMYQRMKPDMDLDAGTILSAGRSVADVGLELFQKILQVASGEKSKSELLNLGEQEFQPWLLGPIL